MQEEGSSALLMNFDRQIKAFEPSKALSQQISQTAISKGKTNAVDLESVTFGLRSRTRDTGLKTQLTASLLLRKDYSMFQKKHLWHE